MTYAVRYYTKTGNTKKLAEAIADALGVEALPISTPVTEAVDVLFLGNSYYAFNIDPEVRAFLQTLEKGKVGRVVNFGSAAMLNSTYKKVKAEADKVGIPMDAREFHCRGEFKGVHKGRPNRDDLAAAAAFAKSVIALAYKPTVPVQTYRYRLLMRTRQAPALMTSALSECCLAISAATLVVAGINLNNTVFSESVSVAAPLLRGGPADTFTAGGCASTIIHASDPLPPGCDRGSVTLNAVFPSAEATSTEPL